MQNPTTNASSDERLWSAIAYAISPLGSILVLLFKQDIKDQPFLKSHNIQALVLGIALWVIVTILTTVTAGIGGLCFGPLGWIVLLYYAYQAYQGKSITIPVITDFVRNQGWA